MYFENNMFWNGFALSCHSEVASKFKIITTKKHNLVGNHSCDAGFTSHSVHVDLRSL